METMKSHRHYDTNGFLIIEDNPIAKCGVFPYPARQLGLTDADQDTIHNVYRSWDELAKTAKLFEGLPVLFGHEWLDPEDGEKGIQIGIISGEVTSSRPYLRADLKILDKKAQILIENGAVVELSPGYHYKLRKVDGEYEGLPYEYEMYDLTYNHLALIDEGRSGHDLRILDCKSENKGGYSLMSKLRDLFHGAFKAQDGACMTDAVVDKEAIIKEIAAISMKSAADFAGGDDEKAKTIIGLAEKLSYDDSQAEDKDEASEPVAGALEVDKSATAAKSPVGVNKIGDMDMDTLVKLLAQYFAEEKQEPAHQGDIQTVKAMDAKYTEFTEGYKASNKAYAEVSAVVGNFKMFDSAGAPLNASEIYKYGTECLSGKTIIYNDYQSAFEALRSQAKVVPSFRVMDSARELPKLKASLDQFLRRV